MAMAVPCGVTLQCTFGLAPSSLLVLPQNLTLLGAMPAATIMDFAPFVNVLPFGMCTCQANPAVAAATAAALGVPTPSACIPVPAGPWSPGASKILIGGFPALSQNDRLQCAFGGMISMPAPGQATVIYN